MLTAGAMSCSDTSPEVSFEETLEQMLEASQVEGATITTGPSAIARPGFLVETTWETEAADLDWPSYRELLVKRLPPRFVVAEDRWKFISFTRTLPGDVQVLEVELRSGPKPPIRVAHHFEEAPD